MKLSTVISCVNNNPNYYLFIPKQIIFWKKFGIKFIAIYVADSIPEEIIKYSENIILWNKNLDINTSFVAQNLRIYYPALLNLPDDEMVMITDMDMLPMSSSYYCDGLEKFTKDDFIYYLHITCSYDYDDNYDFDNPPKKINRHSDKDGDDILVELFKAVNKYFSDNRIAPIDGWIHYKTSKFHDEILIISNNYEKLTI